MTDHERQHIQRMFEAWRQIIGDYKMIHVRFTDPRQCHDMNVFADWCAKQRGAKTGTIRSEVIEEIRHVSRYRT